MSKTLTIFTLLILGFVVLNLYLEPSIAQTISAKRARKEQRQSTGASDVDSFIIESVDGRTSCRGANDDEVRQALPRKGEKGVPVDQLLRGSKRLTQSQNGLTINLVALSQLQTDPNMVTVVAAFERASAVWTSRIKNPITISINIDYGVNSPSGSPFGQNTLGATSSRFTLIDFPGAKASLLASASSQVEAGIYNSFPSVMLNTDWGNGAAVSTNRSLAMALGIPIPSPGDQNVATIGFNKNFLFDFNPDNGITPGQIDFVAVAVHEIGHALGFTSNNGRGTAYELTMWDLFRVHPHITSQTFDRAVRIMKIGEYPHTYFTGQTFNVNGQFLNRLALSTGGPNPTQQGTGDNRQSSHWKDDELTGGQYIGVMDPTIGPGVREEATENDFLALETLGWNLVATPPVPPTPPPPTRPANDDFANAQVIVGCSGSVSNFNAGATREPGEPNHSPDDGGGSRSMWYRWTSPTDGLVVVNTESSSFDTVLGVYLGNSLVSLSSAGKSDDDNTGRHTSRVMFNASTGQTFMIAVDGYDNSGSGGDFGKAVLNWSMGSCTSSNLLQFTLSLEDGVHESVPNMTLTVQRLGDRLGTATVDYETSDLALGNDCTAGYGQASSQCDYMNTRGTLIFAPGQQEKTIVIPIVNDSYAEGTQEQFKVTLSNPQGNVSLGYPSTKTIYIGDNEVANGPNPLSDEIFYVQQHYIDFLNRQPDSNGLNFWTDQITSCGSDAQCVEIKRINVSAAFFLSIEFQETGYLVYRFYKAGFGNLNEAPVPIVLSDFLRDSQRISQNVQVGVGNWQAQLEANKQAYALGFVQRVDFLAAYPNSLTATQFVTQLNNNAGGALSSQEQTNLVNILGATPSDQTKRAQVLRSVAEDSDLRNAEFNRAFVLMQYFGYLRRDPNALPDSNFDGFNFWLNKLDSFGGNFIQAEMVKAFIQSIEYKQRFGP